MKEEYHYLHSTCIRAMDLIRIANQMLNSNMQYAMIAVVESSDEDIHGSVRIAAIPSIDSDKVTQYPTIPSFTLLDPDVFDYYD